jgi:mRNA interferase MazF
MRRGEVWWADLPPPIGRRPVLILSRDSMPAARREITVAYLTTTFRHSAVEVPLDVSDGVTRPCVVNLDSINTIPKASLRHHVCTLSSARMAEVKTAVIEAIDLK